MGAIALLGVVFALGGCANKDERLRIDKEECQNRNNLFNTFITAFHNRCLDVAGGYREQQGSVSIGFDVNNKEQHLNLNTPYKNEKPNKELSEKYLQMGIEQLREELSKLQTASRAGKGCRMIQDGGALNTLRDELHKVQLRCVADSNAILNNEPKGLLLDTPNVRAKLYQYADFTPKQIEDALRKDYPLRAEIITKVCKAYGDYFFVDKEWRGTPENLEFFKRFCNEAQEIYAKGGSYNGVQVFAPNPNHQNVKLAQNAFNAVHNAIKQDELEEKKAEERQRQAEEAKERKYRESIMAPIARDCQGKFKNKEICHIFKHKLLEFHFAREGSQYEADEIFRDLKDYVTKLSPKKLKAMEQELSSKKNLTYKGESYCRWSEPFVWWGLKYQNETDWSLKKSWARVCNFHQDVVLESPFYE